MVLLERSAPLKLLQDKLDEVQRHGRGQLVLVSGEAGVGKTSLVHELESRQRAVPLLEGGGGPLATVAQARPSPAQLLGALGHALRRPHLVVLEDLHWADEATLDVLRLLGRRARSLNAHLVGTYRDDGMGRDHPLRIVLGELPRVDRIRLEPLSPAGVAELAGA